jgi:hypothetical protein
MSKINCQNLTTVQWAAALLVVVTVTSPACGQVSTAAAPASFGVSGRSVLLAAHGVGAQIYECKPQPGGGNGWSFREPVASLFVDGETIGRHFAGPTWELTNGESVKGKSAATAPGAAAGDVPLLKLEVIEHHGDGRLNGATTILRLNTKGGVLSGACAMAGELQAQPYSADYLFLR